MKRKSQMEIMGLVIIIVLLMIGMLFVVKFTILDKPKTVKKSFAEKKLTTLRFGFSVGKTKLSHEIKEARHQIARIKTRMNENA